MESDQNLPKATLVQFIKEVMGDVKCSNDFSDIVLQLCKEYINIISDEANNICLKEGKKTIAADYIYKALIQFNLEEQIPELKISQQEIQSQMEEKRRQKDIYKDEEYQKQLEIEQEKLFKQYSDIKTQENGGMEDEQQQREIEKGEEELKKLISTDKNNKIQNVNLLDEEENDEDNYD